MSDTNGGRVRPKDAALALSAGYQLEATATGGTWYVLYLAVSPAGRAALKVPLDETCRPLIEAEAAFFGRHEVAGIAPPLRAAGGTVWADVSGDTLADRLAAGPRPGDAAPVALSLATTLAGLHGRGVVHRNVHAGSVRHTPAGWSLWDHAFAVDQGGTPIGEALFVERCDPDHLAPECVEEEPSYRAAADVYGVGCVLRDCLFGLAEPPSRRPRWGRADAPDWLRDLCIACLSHSPTKRPSAARLAEALRAGLSGEAADALGVAELLDYHRGRELRPGRRQRIDELIRRDKRWAAHYESVRFLDLERLAARQDAAELKAFLDDPSRITPYCREVAAGASAVLRDLLGGGFGARDRGDRQRHVASCVYCRRMMRMAQAQVAREEAELPQGEELLREQLLGRHYRKRLDAATEAVRRSAGGEQGKRDDLLARLHDMQSALTEEAMALVHEQGDAEEVVHGTFLSVFGALDDFSGEAGQFRDWVLATMKRRSIELLKKRRAAAREVPAEPQPTGWQFLSGAELVRRIRALSKQHDFQTLQWRFVDELSWEEIARRTGKSAAGEKRRFARLLSQLRDEIEGRLRSQPAKS